MVLSLVVRLFKISNANYSGPSSLRQIIQEDTRKTSSCGKQTILLVKKHFKHIVESDIGPHRPYRALSTEHIS